jgi:hypothetical protein
MARYGLAIDRMSTEKLWLALDRRLFDLDPLNPAQIDFRRREMAWREARGIVRELQMRGVQLELPLWKGENVS